MPVSVPGEFIICLGPDDVQETFEVGTMELLLTWLEWVELEIRGFPRLMEDLERLRGVLMVAAVAGRYSGS